MKKLNNKLMETNVIYCDDSLDIIKKFPEEKRKKYLKGEI